MTRTWTAVMSRLAVLVTAAAALDRVLLGKARVPSILTEPGFLQEVLREANLIRKVVGDEVAKVMPRVRRSTAIDWRGATPKQRDAVVRELSRLIRGLPSAFLPGVRIVMDERGLLTAQKTRAAVRRKHKTVARIDPSISLPDKRAIKALGETQSVFFAPEYARQAARFEPRAQARILAGLERGAGRAEIAKDLRDEFRQTAIHPAYWETSAAVHVNRSRSFSSLASYRDAGIEEYQIVAVIDERTTAICLFMDGKTFSVSTGLDRLADVEAAESLDDVKERAPFMRETPTQILLPSGRQVAEITPSGFKDGMTEKQLAGANVSTPPYHHRCRTTVIPV